MKYYNIRVVEASSQEEAVDKICDDDFLDQHDLCDVVLTISELLSKLDELPLKVLR